MVETRCTCGRGCATFGECIRRKGIRIAFCGIGGGDATKQKKWDAELQAYRDAVRQGVEPAGTRMHQVRDAMDKSQKAGLAYNAATEGFIK